MKYSSKIIIYVLATISAVEGFTAMPKLPATATAIATSSNLRQSSSALGALALPRLDLPTSITEKMEDFGLKNPNTLSDAEYRSYSGAAILGTVVSLFLPGALVTGLYDTLGAVLGVVFLDFALSATIGGGAAIYLSLKDDELGATVRKYGYDLLAKAKELTGISTLRYDIPEAVTDTMTEKLGLMNPNDMSEEDYDGYSGAAVAGTLAFFLLPGALLSGATDSLVMLISTILTDFVLSAIVGGGLLIFLSLRDDQIAGTVNQAGSKFLDVVDEAL